MSTSMGLSILNSTNSGVEISRLLKFNARNATLTHTHWYRRSYVTSGIFLPKLSLCLQSFQTGRDSKTEQYGDAFNAKENFPDKQWMPGFSEKEMQKMLIFRYTVGLCICVCVCECERSYCYVVLRQFVNERDLIAGVIHGDDVPCCIPQLSGVFILVGTARYPDGVQEGPSRDGLD